jgi:hypothetical protein
MATAFPRLMARLWLWRKCPRKRVASPEKRANRERAANRGKTENPGSRESPGNRDPRPKLGNSANSVGPAVNRTKATGPNPAGTMVVVALGTGVTSKAVPKTKTGSLIP